MNNCLLYFCFFYKINKVNPLKEKAESVSVLNESKSKSESVSVLNEENLKLNDEKCIINKIKKLDFFTNEEFEIIRKLQENKLLNILK